MRRVSLALLPLLFVAPTYAASAPQETRAAMPTIDYPQTRRTDVAEEQFGEKVADPYRWLENDVRNDAEVAKWVADQNKLTDAYLATLPGRDLFQARLKALFDYERFGVPTKKGGRYFYSYNSGLQNQAVLYVRDSVDGQGRLLLDPNGWSKDGATALGEWEPSEDGKHLLYSVQDGGSDWRTVQVLDVATGKPLADKVEWVKFSTLVWAKDGSGFFYSRFPAPAADQQFQALNENQAVYFHKLGNAQAADQLIYATPETPKRSHTAQVTDDGRYLVVTTTEGTDNRYEVTLIDLQDAKRTPRKLVKGLENEWSLVGNQGTTFYWSTNKGAPRSKIVTMDVSAATPTPRDLIAEDAAVLQGAGIVGGMLVASYLVDAKTEVRRYALGGKLAGKVDLPGIGTAGGFGGDQDDPETFFVFTSFATPSTVYRYDVKTGQASPWASPKVAFDPANYVVEQRFYASKDGTKVPMFVVKRKDVTGPAPTLLYAYGGFNVPVLPGFSASRVAWMEQGGVLAVANIRGGGEYGKTWHDGGRLANKQNVFDDFIGAGEYLIAQGITGKTQLAIQGGSNGGLLVGAVVNQRPDLFAAALPAVGVMDMLRFDRFTAGRYWVDDYGYPSKEADFKVLRAYSPYHNVAAGKTYPAILATTADTDDRVVPGHTFKYTAMLQASDIGPKPHLARIETRAGHGSGKPTDKIIEETADLWAFAAKWTGLEVKPVQ
ncbi:prolyl oligopeptidase family serine peptidase [Sphingomonas qomolangmaensis]|uniref:prolyl oligopeptidase n=1 Tax=Sphingomonas qomolangmaensis TaxID=2918765 RepID=A0ABY5L7I5_9SPHN|nr:prolyl oligopeptidase family serine peptidase [Sphingomonas qomolangmaensis]UUL82933.1 prolyl oligopeptidase family serine peptidase [Sphingomonas qomolangmaensis]